MAKKWKDGAEQWKNMAKKQKDNHSPVNDSLCSKQVFATFPKQRGSTLFFSAFATFSMCYWKMSKSKNKTKANNPSPQKNDIKET